VAIIADHDPAGPDVCHSHRDSGLPDWSVRAHPLADMLCARPRTVWRRSVWPSRCRGHRSGHCSVAV
jgi:hypothetical protein